MRDNYRSEPFVTQIGPRSILFFKEFARAFRAGMYSAFTASHQVEADTMFQKQVEVVIGQADVPQDAATAGLLFIRASDRTGLFPPLTLPHLN